MGVAAGRADFAHGMSVMGMAMIVSLVIVPMSVTVRVVMVIV